MTRHLQRQLAIFATIIGVVAFMGSFVVVSSAHAASCGGIETAIVDCASAKDTTGSPVVAILVVAIQILTALIGVAAIGAFIYAGVLYSSASGNATQVAKSKEIMLNTVIGLVLFAGMGLLLNYFIPGGLFGGNAKFGAGGNGESSKYDQGGIAGGGSSNGSGSLDPATVSATFTIATYNIRATDQTAWDKTRSNAILGYLKTVDTSAIQEGREESVKWLTPRMSSAGYAATSNKWARNVFWKTSKFTKIKEGEKQLPTNGKELIWVKLREKTSGKSFYVATLHLNVLSNADRMREARSALSYMKSSMADAPIIFLGDMNSETGSDPDKLIRGDGFKDAYTIAASKKNMTYRTTLSNFKGGTSGTIDTSSDHQIDHIYIKGNLQVSYVEIKAQKGSDHLPVQAIIVIPK